MDVERSSLCNCVVNFLLEERYLLTAFELLHELLDDGRDAQAIRLKEFFSDPSQFPPDQISRFNTLRVVGFQFYCEFWNSKLFPENCGIEKFVIPGDIFTFRFYDYDI
uniref:LisH domain-containing protein n=1 Tax=Quercus lobata TaxID=97700 RepID=A0A7N2LDP0_QUELO